MTPLSVKKPRERTTAILWPETIPLIDALTLDESKRSGRALTRTQVINALITREYHRTRKETQ